MMEGKLISSKRATMSMEVVVWVIIGLIVLAIVISILVRGTGDSSNNIQACTTKKGSCIADKDPCNGIKITTPDCTKDNKKICCIDQSILNS